MLETGTPEAEKSLREVEEELNEFDGEVRMGGLWTLCERIWDGEGSLFPLGITVGASDGSSLIASRSLRAFVLDARSLSRGGSFAALVPAT